MQSTLSVVSTIRLYRSVYILSEAGIHRWHACWSCEQTRRTHFSDAASERFPAVKTLSAWVPSW